jgi:hypothetical protein
VSVKVTIHVLDGARTFCGLTLDKVAMAVRLANWQQADCPECRRKVSERG